MRNEWSYLIYIDTDGSIKALNGNTGNVDYSGTDAAIVIQNTINALTNGGKISIDEGRYNINSTLTIPSPGRIIIQGENRNTTQLIGKSSLTNLIIVGDAINISDGFSLKDIRIDGGSTVTDILTLRNFKFTSLYNVYLAKFDTGIIFDPYGGRNKAYYGIIECCEFQGRYGGDPVGGTGIKFTSPDAGSHTANANTIIDSVFSLCDVGIHSEYGDTNLIMGCDLADNNIGLKLDTHAHRNRIIGNRGESNNTWDAQIIVGAADNRFVANMWASANKVSDSGTNTKFWHDISYKTENAVLSEKFAIDSTGIKTVAIPHGLNITPKIQDCNLTVVQNTAVDDWSYNLFKVVSTDAKNVVAKIKVSTASATVGAAAKLALKVGV